MEVLGQGVVLMLAGMGIVFSFLLVLVAVTLLTMKPIAKLNSIFPQDAPKKAPARKTAAGSADADVALAIAVAMGN